DPCRYAYGLQPWRGVPAVPVKAIGRREAANSVFHSVFLSGGPSRWLLRAQRGRAARVVSMDAVCTPLSAVLSHENLVKEPQAHHCEEYAEPYLKLALFDAVGQPDTQTRGQDRGRRKQQE